MHTHTILCFDFLVDLHSSQMLLSSLRSLFNTKHIFFHLLPEYKRVEQPQLRYLKASPNFYLWCICVSNEREVL